MFAEIPSGNTLLDTLCGATIHYITPEEYSDLDLQERVQQEASLQGFYPLRPPC